MQIVFIPDPALSALESALERLQLNSDIQAVLMMSCAQNQYPPQAFNELLRRGPKPVFGGFFPQVIWQQQLHERGVVLLGLSCEVSLTILDESQLQMVKLESQLADLVAEAEPFKETLFTFVDGLSPHIGRLMTALFNHYGLELNYIGGGCGNSEFSPMPCVITPRGVLEDAAVLAMAHCHSGIGVAHGWEAISGAFKVTQSDGNRILSLDWQPAYSVYRRVVEAHSGTCLTEQNYPQLAKAYPFGIAMLGAEMVIRDPVHRIDEALGCVGAIRQGAYVHVMHGEKGKLIQAAQQAKERAFLSFGAAHPQAMIFVNCISRALFLGEDSASELTAVWQDGIPLLGALTVGEIANSGGDYLDLYNKTSVVGLL